MTYIVHKFFFLCLVTFSLSLTQSFCCPGCIRHKLWLLYCSQPLYTIFSTLDIWPFFYSAILYLLALKYPTKIRPDCCTTFYLRKCIITMVNKLFHFISFHFIKVLCAKFIRAEVLSGAATAAS